MKLRQNRPKNYYAINDKIDTAKRKIQLSTVHTSVEAGFERPLDILRLRDHFGSSEMPLKEHCI